MLRHESFATPKNEKREAKPTGSKQKTMAIKLKAKEMLMQVGTYKGKYRYVMGTEIYTSSPKAG